jgi:NADPH-dependent glutamate synthase beta subunit-like oxidoreductase/coenzyme F420-reducing hydrogenase delta subunit
MSRQGPISSALVVGNGPASAQAALDLAQAGVGVTLLTADEWLTPGQAGPVGAPPLLEAARHLQINLLTGATVEAIKNGEPGLRVTVCQSPRYVDVDRCTACGACMEICPVTLPGETGAPHKAIYRGGVPTTFVIDKAGMAPCRDACPIDQRAQGYVALIRAGNFRAAYETIKRENPFPSVCGRVCNHRCEDNCTRCQIDEPVALMALKRFVTDWAMENQVELKVELGARSGYRVAVVGSGPAGLTAARELNRLGHAVTVFEALPAPGGMMRVGIPAFRLPRERLQWDVDEILAEGVDLRLSTRVENVENLFLDGYHAVVMAVGLHQSSPMDIPGGEGEGVMGAVEFLRRVNLDERPAWPGKQVIVVGGGSTAIDTARFCRRLGAKVTVVYRRSRAEMPAHAFEVDDAQREGVSLRLLTHPTQIVRTAGQVTAVECIQMQLGEPDESGRRRPLPVPGSEFTLPADVVILAIGQTSDLSLLPADGAATHHRGVVRHDPATLMTERPGLFVAGDVAGTAGFVVDAIAQGLQVARSVDRFLRGGQGVSEPVRQPAVQLGQEQAALRLEWAASRGAPRQCTRSVLPDALLGNFDETEIGLTEAEAIAEAARCLSCGVCSECLACVQVCPPKAIDHEKEPQTFELLADVVIWADGDWGLVPPGVFVAGEGRSVPGAVDQALAHLGLARTTPRFRIAAPSLWRATQYPIPNIQYGIFLCRCGGEIERKVNLSAVAARAKDLPGVTFVGQVDFACHSEGNTAIRAAMAEHELGGAVLAACSCCALDQVCYSCTTQRTRCKERLGVWDELEGLPLQFVNVREQCAFVHRADPTAATLKAGDLVAAGLGALSAVSGQRSAVSDRFPITAIVDPVRCRGCEDCELACGLDAMRVGGPNGARLAQVDVTRCLGCGVCVAVCSSGAILAGDISDVQAEAMLAAMGDLSAKTVALTCNWGAYSAVEAAGVERSSYDPSVRVLRLMCAGRAHEGLILRAFAQGAARVVVLACAHDGDESLCYYHTGSDQAARAVEQAQEMLALLGLDPTRLALVELRPGDATGFVAAVSETRMARIDE